MAQDFARYRLPPWQLPSFPGRGKSTADLVEIDRVLKECWDPAKMSLDQQRAAFEGVAAELAEASQRVTREYFLGIERRLETAICALLSGEHGRIAPGTVLLETPVPCMGGKTQWTQWLMP